MRFQPFFPGALLILSSFYTRKEIAIRIAIMYSGNSLSNCFGGLIAAGVISGMEGLGGRRGWEWLCESGQRSSLARSYALPSVILEGAVTAFVGIAVYFVLPSYPNKCKFFNDEQRRLSVWRTTQDAMGEADEGETSLKKGAKLVFKDWKVRSNYQAPVSSQLIPLFPDLDAHLPANVHQLLAVLYVLFPDDCQDTRLRTE